MFIPKGWPLLTAPRIGQGFWGRPAVLCALPLSPPQMLAHIYIPHNRTPCGRGLCRGSLTDSRGSHRLSSSSLGRLCSPSLICVLIIPHFWRLVKNFFRSGSFLSRRPQRSGSWGKVLPTLVGQPVPLGLPSPRLLCLYYNRFARECQVLFFWIFCSQAIQKARSLTQSCPRPRTSRRARGTR